MSEWISTKNRLPEIGEPILICCKNGEIFSGCMRECSSYDPSMRWMTKGPLGTERRIGTSRVTHWMPMPELPNL